MLKSAITQRYCRYSCSLISRRLASSNSGSDGTDNTSENNEKSQEVSSNKPTEMQTKAQLKLSSLLSSLSKKTSPSTDDGKPSKNLKIELSRPSRREKTKDETPSQLKKQYLEVAPEMASAIKSVSKEVGGGSETESQLLQSLRRVEDTTVASSQTDIKNVLSGLHVDKSTQRPRAPTHVKSWVTTSNIEENVDLFGAEPLGIFPIPPINKEDSLPSLSYPSWDSLVDHNLSQSVAKPPENHFQELINWTNEMKIWSFPVDNEIGFESEKAVGFHEHIFLERHLSGWCPRAGPLRHFMELVCVGLSKNPHITVDRKKNVIIWYKDFFESKKTLLEEVGAYPADKKENNIDL